MTATTAQDRRPRWFQRALPVTGLVLLVIALLTALVPGVRDQLALSASHQPEQYVALSFGRAADGTVKTCGAGRRLKVRFDVESNLTHTQDVAFEVSVGAVRRAGTVSVEPGRAAQATVVVPRPKARRYEIEVRLPDAGQHVLAHCDGAPS